MEVKDVTACGTHPPADGQTIPRIDGKYFQHCGRAGFPHMVCSYNCGCHGHPEETSNPAGRRFKTFHGVNLPRMTPLYLLGQHQAESCRVPMTALQLSTELSIHRTLAHCSTPPCEVADFKAQLAVAMFSLCTPCQQKPLCAGTTA